MNPSSIARGVRLASEHALELESFAAACTPARCMRRGLREAQWSN